MDQGKDDLSLHFHVKEYERQGSGIRFTEGKSAIHTGN